MVVEDFSDPDSVFPRGNIHSCVHRRPDWADSRIEGVLGRPCMERADDDCTVLVRDNPPCGDWYGLAECDGNGGYRVRYTQTGLTVVDWLAMYMFQWCVAEGSCLTAHGLLAVPDRLHYLVSNIRMQILSKTGGDVLNRIFMVRGVRMEFLVISASLANEKGRITETPGRIPGRTRYRMTPDDIGQLNGCVSIIRSGFRDS